MSIIVRCQCGARLRFSDTADGKTARCPRCERKVVVRRGDGLIGIAPPDDDVRMAGATDGSCAIGAASRAPVAATVASPSPVVRRGFWADAGRSFLFFTDHRNLITLMVVIAVNIVLTVLSVAGILGICGALLLGGWLAAFYFNTILESAQGEDILADVAVRDAWDDLIKPGLQFVGTFFLVLAPAVAVGLFAPQSRDYHLPAVLAFAGGFCWPALILLVAIGGEIPLWRPDLVIRTILSSFLPYVSLVVLLVLAALLAGAGGLLGASDTVDRPTTIGGMLLHGLWAETIEAYVCIVSMKLIGLYYYYYKHRFPWQGE